MEYAIIRGSKNEKNILIVFLIIIAVLLIALNIIQFKDKKHKFHIYECERKNIKTDSQNLSINVLIDIKYDNEDII